MTAGAATTPSRDVWSSSFSFLYAAAAAAIGLGTLWRFPYVAGANGGGAFILLYLFFIMVLAMPLMIAEMTIGRRGHGSAVASVNALIKSEKASKVWKAIGWFSIIVPFFGLSYYSVVAGWGTDYARLSIMQGFTGISTQGSHDTFAELMASPVRAGLTQFLFIATVVFVVARGVQKGIEWISRIKMVALFAILIGLAGYNIVTFDMTETLVFLLRPDFSALTPEAVLAALGQALFATAIGVGLMITYSSYLPEGGSLPRTAFSICAMVVIVGILAGLAIFPAVFAYGLTPGEGPNLIFVTLPVAFGQMPGGRIISVLFFSLIALGAFTTSVGMLEPVVAWIRDKLGLTRVKASILAGSGIFAVSLPSLLSFSTLKDFHPFAWFAPLASKTVFDILDFGIANFLLPINALLIALFVGWAVNKKGTETEVKLSKPLFLLWQLVVRFLAPLAVVGLMISML
ncbi:sodium-dependent transporter [Govanella unica]|uniref:Transporter n=1 Tax=Govanella unica TaxID=2975056 RepID=A0A9X3TW90_9PROT|nr:sodium-dependent transporter [Govania unica]MDA5192852.1 sodium-dependent transporter [Govania unica]